MSCFFGDYRRTPFGVHLDAESVFTFPLSGDKKIRAWPDRYVQQHPELRGSTAYEPWMHSSSLIGAGPGGILYWPADHWHVGESEAGVSLTLGIGVYRSDYPPPLARELFEDAWRQLQADFPEASMPAPESVPYAAGGLAELISRVPRAVRVVQNIVSGRLSEEQLRRTRLRLLSAGTLLRPAPVRAELAVADDTGFVASTAHPILLQSGPLELLVGANGHGLAIRPDASLRALIERLNGGEVVRAGQARRAEAQARELLRALHRVHAVDVAVPC